MNYPLHCTVTYNNLLGRLYRGMRAVAEDALPSRICPVCPVCPVEGFQNENSKKCPFKCPFYTLSTCTGKWKLIKKGTDGV